MCRRSRDGALPPPRGVGPAAPARPAATPPAGPRPEQPCTAPSLSCSGRVLPQRHARPLDGHGFVPRASRRRVQDPIIPPYITIDTPRGGQDYVDLAGYLLRSRIILISKRITDVVAVQVGRWVAVFVGGGGGYIASILCGDAGAEGMPGEKIPSTSLAGDARHALETAV